MAFTNTTLAKAAFKKALGKAHTSNEKEIGNESVRSFVGVKASDLFADPISSSASETVDNGYAIACSGLSALSLVLDPSSDGLAYFVVVPDYHPLKNKVNPVTGSLYETGDRVTWAIPESFGEEYRPQVKKGSTIVAPFALENWFFDASAGVITSEIPLNLGTTGTLECHVYTGQSLQTYLDETVLAGGDSGAMAYYQDNRQIAAKNSVRVDPNTDGPTTLTLGEGTNLTFNNSDNSFSASLKASDLMLESYELKLPVAMATEAGQVLAADANGQLFFQPQSATQKGAIALPVGSRMISVVYETPYYDVPTVVQVQWAITSAADFPAIIPNVTIDQITREGFIARWSSAVPGPGYVLRWHTYLAFDYTPKPLTAYVVGNGYTNEIGAFTLDYLAYSTLSATLSSSLSYGQSHSSPLSAYVAGGRLATNTILQAIEKLSYSTESVSALAASLPEPKARAASVGSQVKGFFAGGRNSSAATTSVLLFDTISESASVLSNSLNNTSESKGSFNGIDYGYVVLDDQNGTITKLAIVTETLNEVGALGVDDASCGCNAASSSVGYLSRTSNSQVLKYLTALDTASALSATLSSAGQSCGFNSLVSGFFVGSSGVDAIDFATDTISVASSDLLGDTPGSANAFQSQGLL